jgi:biotin operon repressor
VEIAEEEHVIAFVKSALTRMSDLELLLLLRSTREKSWSTEDLVRELRASSQLVAMSLAQLQACGMAQETSPGSYRFAPTNATLEQLAESLETLHREKPFLIMRTIIDSSDQKLKNFSDAFRFKD